MIKYLKSKQEYIDRYDHITVDDCRRRAKFHKDFTNIEDGIEKSMCEMASDISLYFDLLYTTLNWYENKEKTISDWMGSDERRDSLLENTKAPENIRCLKCFSITIPNFKDIHDWSKDKRERVLFMYDCPNGCLPRRALFDDGEEYHIKTDPCPKCNSGLQRKSDRVQNDKVITKETCLGCGYVNLIETKLSNENEEEYDIDYAKDRELYCLTEEVAKKKREEKWSAERMSNLVKRWQEEDKEKDLYEALAKIEKLTVFDLEKLLAPLCEKAGYVKFQFGNPDMCKDLFLPLSVYDSKSTRDERASTYDLQNVLKKALKGSNWRLMSDGISYRLGIVSGRLRAYERREDLISLIKSGK